MIFLYPKVYAAANTAKVAELFAVEHEDELPGLVDENQTMSTCPFLVDNNMHSEWAYKAPVLLILACNMVFLIYIMTVSVTKDYRVSQEQLHFFKVTLLLQK